MYGGTRGGARGRAAARAARGLVGCALAVLAGCASPPAVYKPTVVGSLGTVRPADGLALEIEAERPRVRAGDPVVFTARLSNAGAVPVFVPRDPPLVYTWVCANGVNDNQLRDLPKSRRYEPSEVVLLRPGDAITRRVEIGTEHLAAFGVTEFRAFASLPENLNPEVEPFARGKPFSNRFGVVVERGVW